MFGTILIIIAAIVVIFVLVVAMQPSQFRVERSTTISAPPVAVFGHVNDFRKWDAWSPWAKLDPRAKNSFEGTPGQVGSVFGWSGNNKIGEGQMTLTESRPGELVRINIEFVRPFKGKSTAEFTFKPAGERTQVVWSMFGNNNFMGKAFCLFVNQDKMLGGEFEKGLAQMKTVAEAAKA